MNQSYPPALLTLLPIAKLILMVFAAYPLYICFWKAVDALGDGFRPKVTTIFWWSSEEEPANRRCDPRSLLIWGISLALGISSLFLVFLEIAVGMGIR